MKLAAATALLVLGCSSLFGDLDRIIAIEIQGPVSYALVAGDTIHLRARAVSAGGDTVAGAVIEWATLDTGTVGIELDPASGTVAARLSGTWRVQAKVTVEQIRSDPITIKVSPGTAATLSVTGIGDSVVAGTASNVTVTARDAFGNIATGYLGSIRFTSTDSAATLPADYTFSAASAGVHTFAGGVTLRTPGPHSVTATDVVNGSVTGRQTGITVVSPVP